MKKIIQKVKVRKHIMYVLYSTLLWEFKVVAKF